MKPNRLTLSVLIIFVTGCFLLLQAGCEEEAMEPRTLNPDWFNQQTWAAINQQAPQQALQQPPQRKVTAGPGIAFEKVTHNFGDVAPGTNQVCEFRFTNTGNAVLRISDITKVCGCTPFSLDKTEYAPGESGTLRVRYYAEPPYGNTKKQLFVQTNDRRNPKITLNIEARVAVKVDFEPKALRLSLKHQNAGCPQITIRSLDNQPFSIRSFKSTSNFINAAYNPSVVARSFVLQPIVDMARLEQNLNGRIEIELTHPECKIVTIGVNTLPRFNVTPRPIVVREVQENSAVTKKIRIQNNYKDAFELESVRSKKGIVQIAGSQKLKDGYELELRIVPPAQRNRASLFTDTVVVNIKGGGNLEIPFNGYYPRRTAVSRVPINTEANKKSEEECKTCGPKIF
jgi:hypothetical protein